MNKRILTENHRKLSLLFAQNLYLEEFEDVVDELLLRLSVMSDSDYTEENHRCLTSVHNHSVEVTF